MSQIQNLVLMGIKGTEDWYFGPISRNQANEILLKGTVGMYLVRASSEPGNFALSVRDKTKVNHYRIIAARRQTQEGYKFKIGPQEFISIHHIIEYYKKNKLCDSTLTIPTPRLVYRAKCEYKPESATNCDASENIVLRRNDTVLLIDVKIGPDGIENAAWWRVWNQNTGEIGYVPLSFLRQSSPDEVDGCKFSALCHLPVPFDVLVMRPRNPNIFETNQLSLKVNDIVQVKQVIQDQPEFWVGVNQRTKLEGRFPFNYVQPVSEAGENCYGSRYSGVSSHNAASSRCGGGGPGSSGNRGSQMSGCTLDEHQELETAA